MRTSGGRGTAGPETGKPIAQVARELGINEGTLGNRVNADGLRRAAVPEWVSLLPDECRPPIGVGAAEYASG